MLRFNKHSSTRIAPAKSEIDTYLKLVAMVASSRQLHNHNFVNNVLWLSSESFYIDSVFLLSPRPRSVASRYQSAPFFSEKE